MVTVNHMKKHAKKGEKYMTAGNKVVITSKYK